MQWNIVEFGGFGKYILKYYYYITEVVRLIARNIDWTNFISEKCLCKLILEKIPIWFLQIFLRQQSKTI